MSMAFGIMGAGSMALASVKHRTNNISECVAKSDSIES
jgi:hypothetical protein